MRRGIRWLMVISWLISCVVGFPYAVLTEYSTWTVMLSIVYILIWGGGLFYLGMTAENKKRFLQMTGAAFGVIVVWLILLPWVTPALSETAGGSMFAVITYYPLIAPPVSLLLFLFDLFNSTGEHGYFHENINAIGVYILFFLCGYLGTRKGK